MLQVFNPWKKNQVVPHTITTCRYYQLDYTANQNPIVIPYHVGVFWTGANAVDLRPSTRNGSLQKYSQLNAISWGVEWLMGEIEIEVFAVTRQRLIQTGSTNYLTYDFETGQNLFFATADRQVEAYQVTQYGGNCTPLGAIRTTQTNLFSSTEDDYTKEEIPMKFKKIYKVHFPTLSHETIYKPIDINNARNYRFLIPGAQGTSSTSHGGGIPSNAFNYLNNTNFLNQTNTANTIYGNIGIQQMQPQGSYPRIHLAQPEIADETGMMKFRFPVRVTTRLHLNMHLIPDYLQTLTGTNSYTASQMLQRQVLDLPNVQNDIQNASTGYTVYCFPYRFKC